MANGQKSGKKFGRCKDSPSHKRYNAEKRSEANKARKMRQHAKHSVTRAPLLKGINRAARRAEAFADIQF